MEPIMIEGTWRKRLLASKLKVPAKYKYQAKWRMANTKWQQITSEECKNKRKTLMIAANHNHTRISLFEPLAFCFCPVFINYDTFASGREKICGGEYFSHFFALPLFEQLLRGRKTGGGVVAELFWRSSSRRTHAKFVVFRKEKTRVRAGAN